MKKTNQTIGSKYNSPIALRLRGLLEKSPKTGERTTYKVLAEYLKVKQQSVSSWVNGTSTPDTKHVVAITDYFGVSCDYLLRGVEAENISIYEKTGLSDETIRKLSEWREKYTPYMEMVNFLISGNEFAEFMELLHRSSLLQVYIRQYGEDMILEKKIRNITNVSVVDIRRGQDMRILDVVRQMHQNYLAARRDGLL